MRDIFLQKAQYHFIRFIEKSLLRCVATVGLKQKKNEEKKLSKYNLQWKMNVKWVWLNFLGRFLYDYCVAYDNPMAEKVSLN